MNRQIQGGAGQRQPALGRLSRRAVLAGTATGWALLARPARGARLASRLVEEKTVQAIELAQRDLGPAELRLGKSRAVGANHDRTTKEFRTDEAFAADSTDRDRWLDTMVHVLHFQRPGGRRDLLWYHFSAHPVCYADDIIGYLTDPRAPFTPGAAAGLTEAAIELLKGLRA